VSPEFAKIVNTNTNIKCLLGLNDPDTADFFARHMGTETQTKFTERVEERDSWFGPKNERTGSKSMRETESYKVHPNRLKNLSAGEGVIHVPGRPDAVTEEIQYFDLHSLGLLPKNNMEAS
jgi:type IV secretory pathway TraG/TraD family ATPase VirD4